MDGWVYGWLTGGWFYSVLGGCPKLGVQKR